MFPVKFVNRKKSRNNGGVTMIPNWALIVGILIVVYILVVVYTLGITFSLVTKNNLGVFSEHPLTWTILIAIGSPISFLCFKFLIVGLLFDFPDVVFKNIPWEFTITKKSHIFKNVTFVH